MKLPGLRRSKKLGRKTTRVKWYQWSVLRLAAFAMLTVIVGFVTAAVTAVQSIDHLMKIVHDEDVEWALHHGMEQAKSAYSAKQELVLEKLTNLPALRSKVLTSEALEQGLKAIDAGLILGTTSWQIYQVAPVKGTKWESRQELLFEGFVIEFGETDASESFRKVESILQRYKLIGMDLQNRIRPAVIRALGITLAVMCLLLLSSFIVMASRVRGRIQEIVDGFEKFAEADEQFRFRNNWQSELGVISQQFNTMADELAENRTRAVGLEKLASWQTIARKMAHEIKNPLTPIQIMIGQLKRNYKGDDEKFKTLVDNSHKVILEEVASLRRMVDDFSEFARLPRAELKLSDLVSTAQKAVDLAESAYLPHVVRLESTIATLPAEHDDQLLRHVIHNLIKNAAEADPKSDLPITVRVSLEGANAVVVVHDAGPGVPQDLKDQIFEAYVTTKHTGPTPGMGLGLAICQKVVFEHGGTLKLASEPGNTTFTIIFPIHKKAQSHG